MDTPGAQPNGYRTVPLNLFSCGGAEEKQENFALCIFVHKLAAMGPLSVPILPFGYEKWEEAALKHFLNISMLSFCYLLLSLRRVKRLRTIWFFLLFFLASLQRTPAQESRGKLDFFGDTLEFPGTFTVPPFTASLSETSVRDYINALNPDSLQVFLDALLRYRKANHPDDWLYYQLVRKVAQYISPKADNYYRYTFYKWWFLSHSGFDARLAVSDNYLLFYVQCDENIYNIPSRMIDGRQYVCLNYHDYGSSIDFEKHHFTEVTPYQTIQATPFSYKVNHLPDFRPTDYTDKELEFSDGVNHYTFHIKVNTQVKTLFTNYPVVDYDLQFNTPLSKTTYESLIPSMKKQLRGMKKKDGVEFLMRLTRYSFLFKPDREAFGGEKRLTPEQTLLSDFSDCEDRAALFFFLVKEIYNLPMLVLIYPQHVTVAVQFEKPYGKIIEFNGNRYSICEPSPQKTDLRIGQMLPELRHQTYQIAYAYKPF